MKASPAQLSSIIINHANQSLEIQQVIKQYSQTLLVFVRHFNCYVCRDQVKVIQSTIKQEELVKQNKNVIIIACSNADAIESFSQDTGFPKENIFVNPDLKTYTNFGLERAQSFAQMKGTGQNPDAQSSTLGGFAWSIWKRITRGDQGDVYQLGGEFLLNSEGELLLSKANKSTQDYLTAVQLREVLKL